MEAVSQKAESYIKPVLRNPYAMAIIKILIVLYAAHMAPKPPVAVSNVFQNTFFKIFALFVIVYLSEKDFQLAVIFSIVFVLGLNVLSGRGVLESFANYSSDYKADTRFTLIEPKSIIYPGCHNLTMNDLYDAFNGDKLKLHANVEYAYKALLEKYTTKDKKEILEKIARASGLPYNINFTDESAPYIATLLMYHGFGFGEDCHAPQ